MKLLMPWFCILATSGMQLAFADNGLDAYREGDYFKAAPLLSNKMNQDPVVDYYLGKMWLYGYGQLKANDVAIRYFIRAGNNGFLPAQQVMGRYALLKQQLPAEALVWFKKAAEGNDAAAQMYCAAAYLFGFGVKKNPEIAKKYYIAAAKNGNSVAQYTLAETFINSHQAANRKLGIAWLTKAVAQGNPAAQLKLAKLYDEGQLVQHDSNKANELLNAAITQHYRPAMYHMAERLWQQRNEQAAFSWYKKAAEQGYLPAQIALAKIYLQPQSTIYDPKAGFLSMLKAAENGSSQAQLELATFYKEGVIVEKDDNLAAAWQKRSIDSAKSANLSAENSAAEWLSMGLSTNFPTGEYQLHGIFSDWHNRQSLQENSYNQSPQMTLVSRQQIYAPKFEMVLPNTISISDMYDFLPRSANKQTIEDVQFPHYPVAESADTTNIEQLHHDAILGDSSAQFILGQIYQYGIHVKKDIQQAITFYKLAASQEDLRAKYTLGMIYLEGQDVPAQYQSAQTWLNDAAFKGNEYAQYVLAHIQENGYQNSAGEQVIHPKPEQSLAMYYLAADNNYGPAQYRLAEILARQTQDAQSELDQSKRRQLIKQLYCEAFHNGVKDAELPLAFFNAMDSDPQKQASAFAVAKRESLKGNKQAALLLGFLYDRGIAVPTNRAEAISYYQQAEASSVVAFILGTYYSQGIGTPQDQERGRILLQQAANAGFSYANINLAIMKKKIGEEFIPELERGFTRGNTTAGILLADHYLSEDSDDKNMQQAFAIYQQLADTGNQQAQLKLGFMYEQGLGTQANAAIAQKWYSLAAEQGSPIAQFLLGHLNQLGWINNQPDYAAAKKWYASAQGKYAPAAVALGFIYDTVDENYQHAAITYEKAAQAGDATAQFNLGLIYEKGKGIAVDYDKAKALYELAAAHGHPQAMVQLAGLYLNIDSKEFAPNQLQRALAWYKKAADLGDRDALYQLGLFAEIGLGSKLSLDDAVNYYQKAANKNNTKAIIALARIYQYGSAGIAPDELKAIKYYQHLATINNSYAQYQLAMLDYQHAPDKQQVLDKTKKILLQIQDRGFGQANKALQWLESQSSVDKSFIEPVRIINHVYEPLLARQAADMMYMNALNAWNSGDEHLSRMIFDKIRMEYPDYVPAKHTYERLIPYFL
ncbi:MAG: tetratricopeptide repeat protein [Legionella sp.]